MRQFVSIATNTLMELIRQPVFLLLMTLAAAFNVFLAAVPYFGFGDDTKLVKDSTLAVMLLAGLFGAVLSASASVAREIRSGTALAVLSKPISRGRFLLAKYAGLAAALTLSSYVILVSSLLASRMAFDAYGDADTRSLSIFFGALVLAYGVAGFSNYFLRRPFVADAVVAVAVGVTAAFVIVAWFTTEAQPFGGVKSVDWRLVPAGILILFALWVLAGLALACATRLELIPTLAVCTGVFLLGLMSDYLFGRLAEPVWVGNVAALVEQGRLTGKQKELLTKVLEQFDANRDGQLSPAEATQIPAATRVELRRAGLGGAWWAAVFYTLAPNWQLFWMSDALEGKGTIPWSYVGKASVYMASYLGAALAVGLWLFEHRELS